MAQETKFQTVPCAHKFGPAGSCKYGNKCHFNHDRKFYQDWVMRLRAGELPKNTYWWCDSCSKGWTCFPLCSDCHKDSKAKSAAEYAKKRAEAQAEWEEAHPERKCSTRNCEELTRHRVCFGCHQEAQRRVIGVGSFIGTGALAMHSKARSMGQTLN
jgi:hypothetical protein